MIEEIIKTNLSHLDKDLQKNILSFCTEILLTNHNEIESISTYSDNKKLLFILDSEKNISFFYKNSDLVKKFYKKNLTSLFITQKHIETSQDVFPLEFLEIKQTYKLIYGHNSLDIININASNLRLQSEQQIKGLLIRLYQLFIEIKGDKKQIQNIIHDSIEILFNVLKGIIFINLNQYLSDKNEILNKAKELFNLDIDPINKILLKEKYNEDLINQLLKTLQDFAYIIDGIKL